MLTLQLYEIDNNFDELERRLIELQKSEAFVGYDQEQGEHEGSEIPFTNLISLHSSGYDDKFPARPIFEYARLQYKPETSNMKKDLKKYFTNIDIRKSKSKVDNVLEGWVEDFSDEVLDIFGSTPPLEENTESTIAQKKKNKINSPLVDDGELRDNLAYRINENALQLVKDL